MMKSIKALSALIIPSPSGDRLIQPQSVVAIDRDLADAFIASGDAVEVKVSPAVVEQEVLAVEALPEAEVAVDAEDVIEDDPQPAPKFGKRGR